MTWLKRQTALNLLPAIFAQFVCAPIMWLLFDRSPVVTLSDLRVTPNTVMSGGRLEIKWNIDQLRVNCEGTVTQEIIASNSQIYPFAPEPTVYHEAGKHEYIKEMVLPAGMVPGRAIYRSNIVRWCNSLQRVFWPMQDQIHDVEFNVIASSVGEQR